MTDHFQFIITCFKYFIIKSIIQMAYLTSWSHSRVAPCILLSDVITLCVPGCAVYLPMYSLVFLMIQECTQRAR